MAAKPMTPAAARERLLAQEFDLNLPKLRFIRWMVKHGRLSDYPGASNPIQPSHRLVAAARRLTEAVYADR